MKHITIIAGARPNFMKVAPIIHEIIKKKNELRYYIHTRRDLHRSYTYCINIIFLFKPAIYGMQLDSIIMIFIHH